MATRDPQQQPGDIARRVRQVGNDEQSGVLAAVDIETRDRRLATLSEALALDPMPVDQPVAEAWARLRVLLRDMQKRMPVKGPDGSRANSRRSGCPSPSSATLCTPDLGDAHWHLAGNRRESLIRVIGHVGVVGREPVVRSGARHLCWHVATPVSHGSETRLSTRGCAPASPSRQLDRSSRCS
jgi:hypothetical protein